MRLAAPLLFAAMASPPLAAQAPAMPGLEGAWTVDLSAEPGKPYVKEMVLQLQGDGTVGGSFYDSSIEAGQWKTANGRTCASFRTTDGAGPYHSAACLNSDGTVSGQTWAEHRNFLFNWNATRKVGGE